MKKKNTILNCLICLILCGCITEYIAPNIDGLSDILVVEGVISDDSTTIMLSRSMGLLDSYFERPVDNARVFVEKDDGTQWVGEYIGINHRYQQYVYLIKTGALNLENKYRLKIEIEEPDYTHQMGFWEPFPTPTPTFPMKTYEYCSDFSYPIRTPEIDSIVWIKRGEKEPVMIYVATNSPGILYYRWSYKEDWEVNAEIFLEGFPYNCWNNSRNEGLLIGTAERVVQGKLKDIIVQIVPSNRRFSSLYRISIKQNGISKRCYDYFANIKKNAENIGSIFSPIPSELRGNIVCTTDPDRPVIGYVDVSTTTTREKYISRKEVYEWSISTCEVVIEDTLLIRHNGIIPDGYVLYDPGHPPYSPPRWVFQRCVDCTFDGFTEMPENWGKLLMQ